MLYLTELASICAAYGLMLYFDSLPGYGPLEGITYFAETMYSLGAVVFISVVAGGIVWLQKK